MRIYPPFRFEMKLPGECNMAWDDLLTGAPGWFDKECQTDFCWPWLKFWEEQIQYWRLKAEEHEGLVEITESGFSVNRPLYERLGEESADGWEWWGDGGARYVGGIEDIETVNSPGMATQERGKSR